MGFNNWNSTHCRAEFNETMVKGIADLFVEKELKEHQVNLDDCWALPSGKATASWYPTRCASERDQGGRRSCTPRGSSSASTPARARRATASDCRAPSATSTATPSSSRTGHRLLSTDDSNDQGVDAKLRYTTMPAGASRRPGGPGQRLQPLRMGPEQAPAEMALDVGHLWRTTGDIRRQLGLDAVDPQAEPARRTRVPVTGTTRTCWRSATAA